MTTTRPGDESVDFNNLSPTESVTFAVHDPATLEVIGHVADLGVDDVLAACARAAEAFKTWSRTSPRERSDILRGTFELMLRDQTILAQLISRENGKSTADAKAEVLYAAEFFRWFAEEAVRTDGQYGDAPSGGVRTVVSYRPIGVTALVTPWNFPAAMAARKIAPALAAGCTAILKPAAETPLTALSIGRLLHEAGLPEGVVEIVTSTDAAGVVSALMADDNVRKVSFTGSTQIGRNLLRQASDRVLNASMELGGNAPVVVTAGANIAEAVAGTMIAKFRNGGQACTAANRIYVHATVAAEFVAALGAEVNRLAVGSASSGAVVGPLISQAAVSRVSKAVDEAVRDGARVAFRARVPEGPGYFYPPTVLTDVRPEASILKEEIFGPVAPIVVWDDEGVLLREINNSEFGLAAYVFDADLGHALRLAERIHAGMVGVNRGSVSDPSAPFGGVKQSGLGREGAREGLREFQEIQYLSIDWPQLSD